MILEIENLHKSYERNAGPVLHGVNLSLPAGKVAAVVGESGSGKSTLLKTIAGLEWIDEGRILLNGGVVSGPHHFVPPEKRHVGYLFQDFALFPHMDVARNVGFGLTDRAQRQSRVKEILALVGMEAHHDKYPHELSGGEQQRVALARAMAPNPTLLLLDEPFSNLDVHVKKDIRSFVFSVIRSTELSCIFVTHDLEDAQEFADTVSILHEGQIAQSGSPEELYSNPSSAHVAGFFGEINILDQKMIDCFKLSVPANKTCGIRLSDVRCALEKSTGIQARVLKKTHMGHFEKIRVEIPDIGSLELLVPFGEINSHEQVYISIDEKHILQFEP